MKQYRVKKEFRFEQSQFQPGDILKTESPVAGLLRSGLIAEILETSKSSKSSAMPKISENVKCKPLTILGSLAGSDDYQVPNLDSDLLAAEDLQIKTSAISQTDSVEDSKLKDKIAKANQAAQEAGERIKSHAARAVKQIEVDHKSADLIESAVKVQKDVIAKARAGKSVSKRGR